MRISDFSNEERPWLFRHGMLRSGASAMEKKLHKAWDSIRNRCKKIPKYAGKGIMVCERWQNFHNFAKDMGFPPSLKHTIDRIDGTKGYSPENCRWATYFEQNRNRCNTVWLTCNGETLHITEWKKRLGSKSNTIEQRLKRGWTVSDAVTTPLIKNNQWK